MDQNPKIKFDFWEKQSIAFHSTATEILYGGAAGGGKSHLIRGAAIGWCSMIEGLQVYLFRRITKDLIKNHLEGPNGFRNMLTPLTNSGFCKIVDKEIRFWNDSKIYLCHCEHEKNMYDFDGAEIHVLFIDELTHFTEKIYRFLRGRVRMVGLEVPEQLEGRFPRILSGTNPGNVGHLWVKRTFIDHCDPFEIRQMPPEEGGMLRQYIPALLEDNPSMLKDDPLYEAKLLGLGSKALVDAKRFGIWDIIEGAFFDNWSPKNIIEPFEIPAEWMRFRSMDWGSAKPFAIGWYAVSPGYNTPYGLHIPKGALVKYREWYGCQNDKEDVGLKLTSETVAKGILYREKGEDISYSVADPAIFAKDDGPIIASKFAKNRVYFRRAKNKRVSRDGKLGGWDEMRSRITGDDDGRPMLYFFKTCRDSIRTIPALLHDEDRPEDVNTNMEDHCGDETRYACMSRPWVKKPVVQKSKKDRYSGQPKTANGWKVI